MGAFFTNVQVHTGSLDAQQARQRILDVLRTWAAEQGQHELTDDDQLLGREVHRTIVVGPATDGPWLAVFDELTEDQRHEDMQELTRRLSRVAGHAVGVLDQHSDMLALWLAHDGELTDEYRSQQVAGNAELWRNVLVDGATANQLRTVFDTNAPFAEDLIHDLAPLFGWDIGMARMGFEYLDRGLDAHDPQNFSRLDLRSSTDPLAALRGSGPPVFVQGISHPLLSVAVGEPITGFIAMFQSTGGAGAGLGIVVWGPGLDLLDLDGVEVSVKPGSDLVPFELVHSVATGGTMPLRYVDVPDFPIPRGMMRDSYQGVTGMSMRRAMAAQFESCIGVTLKGRGAQRGSAELHIGVTPDENREAGQTSFTVQVTVT